MRLPAAAVGLALSVLCPGFGCGEEVEFGPDEMRRAGEGTWELSFEGDREPRAVLLLSFASARSPNATTFNVETGKAEAPFTPATRAGLIVVNPRSGRGALLVDFSSTAQLTIELMADGTVTGTRFRPASGVDWGGLQAVHRP